MQRRFTPTGAAAAATNDTLWWSVSEQRSRLDIDDRAAATLTSTVTDPLGTGLAFSARTSTGANGSTCSCGCFGFRTALTAHSFLGPGVLNCTRVLPDAPLNGSASSSLARRWLVFAEQPAMARIEYWAEESGPWPLRIQSSLTGTQVFGARGPAVPASPDVFAPQACCRGVPPSSCRQLGADEARLRLHGAAAAAAAAAL